MHKVFVHFPVSISPVHGHVKQRFATLVFDNKPTEEELKQETRSLYKRLGYSEEDLEMLGIIHTC